MISRCWRLGGSCWEEFLLGRLAQLIGRWLRLPVSQTWAFPDPEPSAYSDLARATAGGKFGLRGWVRLKGCLRAHEGVLRRGSGGDAERRNTAAERRPAGPWTGQAATGTVSDHSNRLVLSQPKSRSRCRSWGRLVKAWSRGRWAAGPAAGGLALLLSQ